MRKGLLIILLLHLLMYLATGLNIPVFRQLIVFAYASFIPGFILLKIIDVKEIKTVDRILLSIGLSISFLMFIGFVINSLYGFIGISQPLSFTPLLITVSLLTLGLSFIGYRRDFSQILSSGSYDLNLKSLITASFFAVPLILAIMGAIYDNIFVLILMIISVSILFALAPTKFIPAKLYPLMIFAVSLSLVFHFSLISQNIRGSDINLEYYVYKLTEINGHWATIPATTISTVVDAMYSGCLSVTILPTIYSTLMNFGGEIFFKLFYPFVYALVPVILYRIYGGYMTKLESLISALFFISGFTVFYGMQPLSVGRQIIAVFFMMLSVFILLNNQISKGKGKALFIIFSLAVIVSHYSTAFLYLASLFFVYFVLRFKHNKHEILDNSMLALISIFLISWCSLAYVYQQPLVNLLDVFRGIYSNFFNDLTSTSARSSDIFASHPILNTPSLLNWTFLYAANLLVAIGILYLILKPGKKELNLTFRAMVIFAAVILFLSITVPNVAPSLQFGRFYSITLLFLAPCLVLGVHAISGLSKRMRRRIHTLRTTGNTAKAFASIKIMLIFILLIGYLLTQIGFINKVAGGSPISVPLDFDRMYSSSTSMSRADLSIQIHPEEDYISIDWLLKNVESLPIIYGDDTSTSYLLHGYGLIPMENLYPMLNNTIPKENAYIYLRSLNVNEHIVDARLEYPFQIFNITENVFLTGNGSNIIYSNGQSEILEVP